ncbi:Unknown protein, partial [Striga hermonthica]
STLDEIDQIMARYFWGYEDGSGRGRRTHWVSWDSICRPFAEGGLGIRRLRDIVTAFSYKLWWRFREGKSLWAQYLRGNYCPRRANHPCWVTAVSHDSRQWRRLTRVGRRSQDHIFWALGEGDVSFWDEWWLGDRPLSSDRP